MYANIVDNKTENGFQYLFFSYILASGLIQSVKIKEEFPRTQTS